MKNSALKDIIHFRLVYCCKIPILSRYWIGRIVFREHMINLRLNRVNIYDPLYSRLRPKL